MKKQTKLLIALLMMGGLVASCRKEVKNSNENPSPDEPSVVEEGTAVEALMRPNDSFQGFYLLNEGAYQSNKSTLDFADFTRGRYISNLFALRNPSKVKELGDTGNDLKIYGSKLYIVVNGSHKVEVLDAYTGRQITQINIANGRYLHFHKGNAYVSSYASSIAMDASSPGAVYRVDTASLQITGQVTVGYQPEEMEIIGDYLFVANSGGYKQPSYDNTISVVNLGTFQEVKKLTVGVNPHRVRKDAQNRLWVTTRGDYKETPGNLHCVRYDAVSGATPHVKNLDIPATNIAIDKDNLYYTSSQWDATAKSNKNSYGVVQISTQKKVKENFINENSSQKIKSPYGLAIHPTTGEIFVMDAADFTSGGTLFIFSADGTLKAEIPTGDLPNGIVFLPKR